MVNITDLPVGILVDIFSMLTLKQLCNIESGNSSLLFIGIYWVESKITLNFWSHFQIFRNFAQLNVARTRLEGPSVLHYAWLNVTRFRQQDFINKK